ncbi:MAG: DEAD/DEAH box helicase family protein, partial [Spirochaetaceae bacterium]|nr:DEAD/DEAH box helicase family protein [Spirochaetaceae bacterium]
MQQRTYLLLLHDAVRSHIAALGSRQKERLREKLEFLRHGMWDAGVRVKKLKGGRSSFEARLTRGDRILFTLGRAPAAGVPGGEVSGAGDTRIYVWGVVKHDDVTAAERRIVAANAPFLDFRPDEFEDLPELVLDDLPEERLGVPFERPFPVAASHGRTDQPGGQSEGGHPNGSAPDAGPQRWLVVDDEEWRRILETEDPDGVRLYLFLTGEQARLLHSEPPVLLSGTAGSGKTTIAVYYLLRHRACQLAGRAIDTVTDGGGHPHTHDVHID